MDKLECFLAEYYEGQFCRLFARGGTGLYTLFRALRKTRGVGEIIIPAICCETVAMAAIYAGMKPTIADVEIKNCCLSYDSVLTKFSDKTKAIILVYIFGNPINPTPFQKLKQNYDVVLIEDLAQSAGGRYAGQTLGQIFDFTLLSFADDKIIKGQGGAIIQRNSDYENILSMLNAPLPPSPNSRVLMQKQRSLRNLSHALYDLSKADPSLDVSQTLRTMIPYYENMIVRQGHISDTDFIMNQFVKITDEQERRYEKYRFYKDHIKNDGVKVMKLPPATMCWRASILLKNPIDTFSLTELLRKNKIPASNHYFPLDKLLYNSQSPHASFIGARIINLWVDDSMTAVQMRKAVDLINSYTINNREE